jgi:hypothetical protein
MTNLTLAYAELVIRHADGTPGTHHPVGVMSRHPRG